MGKWMAIATKLIHTYLLTTHEKIKFPYGKDTKKKNQYLSCQFLPFFFKQKCILPLKQRKLEKSQAMCFLKCLHKRNWTLLHNNERVIVFSRQ